MILLSFENVNRGLERNISMMVWVDTSEYADHIFYRMEKLYVPKPYIHGSGYHLSRRDREINLHGTHIRVRSWVVQRDRWKGFRGIHLIDPNLYSKFTKQQDFDSYADKQFQNERYMDQWRA